MFFDGVLSVMGYLMYRANVERGAKEIRHIGRWLKVEMEQTFNQISGSHYHRSAFFQNASIFISWA